MTPTTETYRAVHATAPGQLAAAERPLSTPPEGHVRIRVEACGVCHTDAMTVEGVLPVDYPRVPGHEVVGRIDAVGDGVTGWAFGQRVGVGFLGGPCGHCSRCRRGDFVSCEQQPLTGVQTDGGYAEVLIARESGLVAIPDALDSLDAAPLLCAGLTTFNALRGARARAGDLVAVLGIGGLGHLGVQYARRMGYRWPRSRAGLRRRRSQRSSARTYTSTASSRMRPPSSYASGRPVHPRHGLELGCRVRAGPGARARW